MRPNRILFVSLLLYYSFLRPIRSVKLAYDVYLQLSQFRTSVRVVPYRLYELRWEIECTTDDRQPITKFPTAFSVDDSRLVFFDAYTQQQTHQQQQQQQDQQNFVYVREVSEMAVVCFRLYYRNELALEDCLVVDVRTSDFADVRYSTKTRAHGNALAYQAQITPSNGLYLLLTKNENNETVFNSTTTTAANRSISKSCIAATSAAVVEAILIILATATVLCLYLNKSGRFSLKKLARKRRTLGTVGGGGGGRFRKKTNEKIKISRVGNTNLENKQSKIVIEPVDTITPRIITAAKPVDHYRAPSAASADSGLSTISNGSFVANGNRNRIKSKSTVPIYDDPPETTSETATTDGLGNETKKTKLPVQDYLTEMWRRTITRNSPPPPPAPDYGDQQNRSDSSDRVHGNCQTLAYDVYAALEDPNNWDPPEQFWSHDDRIPSDRPPREM